MEIKTLYFGGSEANCYIVSTDTAAVVIDPAAPFKEVCAFLEENSDKKLYVFLTHFHFDHILGAKELKEKYGCQIVIGEQDEVGLRDDTYSLSGCAGFSQEPFYPDIKVTDGYEISLGSETVKVIHTPGHTAGSVCYMIGDVIFTGDTLFKYSVGQTHFPTGDSNALADSIKKLSRLPKNFTIYPGHGNSTTLLKEKLHNPYMQEIRDIL